MALGVQLNLKASKELIPLKQQSTADNPAEDTWFFYLEEG